MTGIVNIAEILDAPAREAADRPALIVDDPTRPTVCTYDELRSETGRWIATLSDCGVDRGHRIALVDWGGVRSTAATLAAAHLGAAAAQMNPLLTATELAHLVEVSGCAPVGVSATEAHAALRSALGANQVVLEHAASSGPLLPRSPGGDDDALVLFTSGTTGQPKPIPIGHRAIAARIGAYRAPFDSARAASITMMCVPSFHVGGMLGLLLALYAGDTTVVLPRFDAGRWLAAVEQHHVSSAFLVPAMLARILDHPQLAGTDLASLRSISYGAAAAPVDLVQRAIAQWPDVAFANVFGQTETLGAYASLSPEDHRDPQLIGSVGRPLPGVDVRVVDPATGDDAPTGAVGEVWVRAAQNVTEGWLRTGDLVHRDARGYLFPTGRRSDVINRGGEKFAPVEVADALRDHPAVGDVAVAGVPDLEMGERVGVAIVVRPGADRPSQADLRMWCRDRLAPFKLPEVVVAVDALPYNDLGKLPRRAVVELITSVRDGRGGDRTT